MSATIIPFLEHHSFDPAHLEAMGLAFDRIASKLHDRGQPGVVREIIASRIIEIAKTGERDPNILCDRVLAVLGFERVSGWGP